MDLNQIAVNISKDLTINSTELLVWNSLPLEAQALYVVCKSIFGGIVKVKEKRSNEFFKHIATNVDKFTGKTLQNEQVQEAFIFSFQQYLNERNDKKREAILGILLGFIDSQDKENFELEKISNILSIVSVEDIEIVKIWIDGTVEKWLQKGGVYSPEQLIHELKRGLNVKQYGQFILYEMKGFEKFKDDEYTFEKLNYLVGVGLLKEDAGTSYNGNGHFRISELGKEFVKYIRT